VRRILWRKLNRCLAFHGGDREEVSEWIEDAITAAIKEGLIHDERYVKDKVRVLLRRGSSPAAIRYKLRAKGVGGGQVDQVLQTLAAEGLDPQRIALATFVRKRRMGALARADRPVDSRKELARIGRAGFPIGMALEVLAMSAEEIEDLAFKRRLM
jgi:SOS response regulatory protein OraA/RecX